MAETNLANGKKLGFGERIVKFFKDTKAELKKVTWPTKDQLIHNTGVIIMFIILVTIILSVLDVAFGKMFQALSGILVA